MRKEKVGERLENEEKMYMEKVGGLISLFNGIATFLVYFMPKSSL